MRAACSCGGGAPTPRCSEGRGSAANLGGSHTLTRSQANPQVGCSQGHWEDRAAGEADPNPNLNPNPNPNPNP